jgi:hypothetical protein
VPDIEPELITIVEGPTPEFQPSPYLDDPDAITLRRQSDVVAMRLMEVDAGPLLVLWVRKPFSELQEEEYDDGEDDVSL